MMYPIVIPSLGATGGEITLIEWLAEPGQWIEKGRPLFVVQTDKADMEVEAFRDGHLCRIVGAPGSVVSAGETVAWLTDSASEGPKETPVRYSPEASASIYRPLESGEGLLDAYSRMALIRRFEDYLYELFLQGLVPGTLHQCQGQEAVAVGVCAALERDDVIFSTHRPVGHFIAKGCSIDSIAAELWGKASGCSGGKGGQMHLSDPSIGAYPSNAIVGANIPIATGAALAFRLMHTNRVAVSFFGDGASNIGAFHEGINLAAIKNAPVIFVCENNQYAASTHISLATRISRIADRANSYGISGCTVDGMDVLAVHRAARLAVARARAGEGPTLLEFVTYRYAGHSRGDPGGYRTKEEQRSWREKDPLVICRQVLLERYGIAREQIEHLEQTCQKAVEKAIEFARSAAEPPLADLFSAVYSSGGTR